MPRKKATICSSQLRPLTFVNSPVCQPVPVLTPVFAVDNPVTAKSVTIEDVNRVWVSPQFRFLTGNLRGYLQHISVKERHKSVGLLSQADGQVRKCKYKPLQFLNDSQETLLKDETTCKAKINSECRIEQNIDVREKHSDKDKAKISTIGFFGPELEVDIETPVVTCVGKCDNKENHGISNDKESMVLKGKVRNLNSNRVLTPIENNATISRRQFHRGILCPRNLFSGSVSCDSEILDQRINNSYENQTAAQLHNEGCGFELSSSNVENMPGKQNDVAAGKLYCLVMKTPPKFASRVEVLAADTPECDYDLSLRERQLKYGLKKGMKK